MFRKWGGQVVAARLLVALFAGYLIPSISAFVEAVSAGENTNWNNGVSGTLDENRMFPRPPQHPQTSPMATGSGRPMPFPLTAAMAPLEGLGWSSLSTTTSRTTTTPSPPTEGWGPPTTSSPPPPPQEWVTTLASTTSTTPPPPPSTTASTTVRPASPGWLRCPEKDGEVSSYLPHESSCSHFYQCSHGKPYRLACREGLHFNPYFSVCDWPDLANCPYENKEGILRLQFSH